MENDKNWRISQLVKQVEYQEEKIKELEKKIKNDSEKNLKSNKVVSTVLNMVELDKHQQKIIQHELDHYDEPINMKLMQKNLKIRLVGIINENNIKEGTLRQQKTISDLQNKLRILRGN